MNNNSNHPPLDKLKDSAGREPSSLRSFYSQSFGWVEQQIGQALESEVSTAHLVAFEGQDEDWSW